MSQKILGFEDFLRETKRVTQSAIRKDVKPAVQEFAWAGLTSTGYLTPKEAQWLKENFSNVTTLDESFLGQIRDRVKTAAHAGNEVGKELYAKISKVYDRASTFSKYLVNLFEKAFDKLLGYFKKKFDVAKKAFFADVKSGKIHLKNIKGNIKEELNQLSETATWWLKNFQVMYTKSLETVFSKELLKEALHVDANIINEFMNFNASKLNEEGEEIGGEDDSKSIFKIVGKIAHRLEKVPPFNLLAKIKDIATDATAAGLQKFSELTKKMGGPGVYEFAKIALVVGFFVEYLVKHMAVKQVESILDSEFILKFLPGIQHVIIALEYTALCLVVIETLKEAGEVEQQIAAA